MRELNEIEQTIYISQLIPFLDHHLFSLQMAQEGHLGDDYVGGENFMELLDVLIGDMLRNNPGARQWWESIKFAYPHHDYVNALIDTKQKTKRWTIGTAMAESAP